MLEGRGVQGGEGIKGENWENCNSIVNKIHFKKINKNKKPKKKKKERKKERKAEECRLSSRWLVLETSHCDITGGE